MAYLDHTSTAAWYERRVIVYFIGVSWRMEPDVDDERSDNAVRFIEAYEATCGPTDAEMEALQKRAYDALDYIMDHPGEFE